MSSNELRLPLKKVVAKDGDYYSNPQAKGGAFEPLVVVTPELRETLADQVANVSSAFQRDFSRWRGVPGVARIDLRKNAFAKSKRPMRLFNNHTCPLFGGSNLGVLYATATDTGLRELLSRIKTLDSDAGISHISTIDSISPYDQAARLSGMSIGEAVKIAATEGLRVRLFRHCDDQMNARIDEAIGELLKQTSSTQLNFLSGVASWNLKTESEQIVSTVANFPGARTVSAFPTYKVVKTSARVLGPMNNRNFPVPDEGKSYPVVGVIDTGTDPNNERLQAWVVDRWELVPPDQQDNTHGSFVAGLICNSRGLNRDDRFPSCSAKIVDVVAFNKDGEIDHLQLMYVIAEAVKRYPDVKVWNLSFSIESQVCVDHEFSELAMLLDELTKNHGVQFVVAAGNVDELPPATWPRERDDHDLDRICSPADSPSSLVVGGIAHRETPASVVDVDQPSPFTRRGPSAGYLVSPQLNHVAGNCTEDGDYAQLGVISLDNNSNVAEFIGTSFASPQVASLTANVRQELPQEAAPLILTKAMMLHSAFLDTDPVLLSDLHHMGVGKPPDISEVLHCRQSSATFILQAEFDEDPNVAKEQFPIPSCLVTDGSVRCEIAMTLAYLPPFDSEAGFEYCQTNIDASLGTLNADGKFQNQVKPYPKTLDAGFEKELVKHGFKWSPYKFYYRDFSVKNKLGDKEWRLQLKLKRRAALRKLPDPQTAYLLVTLRVRDSENEFFIYDELVREMAQLGWAAVDLQLRSKDRFRN